MNARLAAALLVSWVLLPVTGHADAVAICLECHPAKGAPSGIKGVPSLAGQHPDYLVRQLERFAAAAKDDPYRRRNTSMAHETRRLPASEWARVAATLSAQACVFHGDADLPAVEPNPCASCHGARGLSGDPAVPNLAGQDLRYLFYQYQKLREPYEIDIPGIDKQAVPERLHPVMGPLAADVHDGVVSILIYYSRLPCR